MVLIFDLDKVNIKNVYQRYNFVRIFQEQKVLPPPQGSNCQRIK